MTWGSALGAAWYRAGDGAREALAATPDGGAWVTECAACTGPHGPAVSSTDLARLYLHIEESFGSTPPRQPFLAYPRYERPPSEPALDGCLLGGSGEAHRALDAARQDPTRPSPDNELCKETERVVYYVNGVAT